MKHDDHKRIEAKWQKAWNEHRTYEPNLDRAKKPFYNLMMFPYPSAEGLHVGNMYAFTGSDIYGRFKRMQGYDVFEPIGLDGFGIHSENYALKVGRHPREQAKISEKNFYRQLQSIGNGFAWEERLETYDPSYYRWTQWLFLQLFNNGLAYRKNAEVNWCPSCKTVLADEQVISGACERCGTTVVRKKLEQWFFKITEYAEKLLKNIENIDWDDRVRIAQRNWIGRSEGAEIRFKTTAGKDITIFTTRPDTLFGATYVVLSPEHELLNDTAVQIKNRKEVQAYCARAKKKTIDERATARTKAGIQLEGIYAINPATKEKIPVWVADYVLTTYGTGAIMAVPAHDQRDFEFAKKYALPIKIVICPHYPETTCPVLDEAYTGEGHLVASEAFNGMSSQDARTAITNAVKGKRQTQYRLRDWLISRQRYWGPPIPVIFCAACAEEAKKPNSRKKFTKGERENPGWIAVPEQDLPVELPNVKNVRPEGKGESPLAAVPSFYKTTCPKCGGNARRETDVSDTFLDSAWYFYRYLDPENMKEPFRKSRIKKWLPVHMYIGGVEHSVLHLLYSRFIAMALRDLKHIEFEEPFTVFRGNGLVIKDGAKMSKSKGNVVVPDEYIQKFGADTLRMSLMFIGPFQEGADFRDSGVTGIVRFLDKVRKFYEKDGGKSGGISKHMHGSIKKITEDIGELRYNTAISELMILLGRLEKQNGEETKKDRQTFLLLLAPFAPHLAEEIWQAYYGSKTFHSIHAEKWPSYDEKLTKSEEIPFVIQINGKVRDTIFVSPNISQKDAEAHALKQERIQSYIAGKKMKKIIFVPGRLINIVI